MKLSTPGGRWHQLAKLNELRLIKTMYVWIFLVPILARVFQSLEETVRVTVFEHTFVLHLVLPFSWIAFYFSALSFAIANVLFEIRCPRLIKDHSGYGDFRDANKGVEHLDNYMHEVGMNWEGLRRTLQSKEEYFSDVAEANNPRISDGPLREQFWAVYSHGDRARKYSRTSTFVLYLLGLLLIALVLVQNTWFVARTYANG